MESDMNKYDLVHVNTRHASMSDAELLAIYKKAWDLYYSPEHVETVIRRARSWGYDPRNMMLKLLVFSAVPRIEEVHPLEGGVFRRKYRRDRRPGMSLESPIVFYFRYVREIVSKHFRFALMYGQYRRILRRALHGSTVSSDVAMTPVQEDEFETLEMYTATPATRIAVEKMRRYKRRQSVPGV